MAKQIHGISQISASWSPKAFNLAAGSLLVLWSVVPLGYGTEPERPRPTGLVEGEISTGAGFWVYSEPFNLILTQSYLNVWGPSQRFESHSRNLARLEKEGDFKRIDGQVAWVDLAYWQKESRAYQRHILLTVAENGSQSLDYSDWHAQIREAGSDEILAATSPNGMRALWSKKGFAPEPIPKIQPPDTSSPMNATEQALCISETIEFLEQHFADRFLLKGEILMFGSLVNGGATVIMDSLLLPIAESGIDDGVQKRTRIAVLFKERAIPSVTPGTIYSATVKELDLSGTSEDQGFPVFEVVFDEDVGRRILTEYKKLSARRTP